MQEVMAEVNPTLFSVQKEDSSLSLSNAQSTLNQNDLHPPTLPTSTVMEQMLALTETGEDRFLVELDAVAQGVEESLDSAEKLGDRLKDLGDEIFKYVNKVKKTKSSSPSK